MTSSKKPNVLALIPARGGSKGVPGKNILPLNGRPMISWVIAEAMEAAAISRTIVSSDSNEIITIAKQAGAEAPFRRPEALATDTAGVWEVLIHCLDWLEVQEKYVPDTLVLLQANSPFVKAQLIDKCYQVLLSSDSDVVYTVSKIDHPPHWIQTLDRENRPAFFVSPDTVPAHTRRQDMPTLYRPTGTVSVSKVAYLRDCRRRSIVPGFHLPIANQRSTAVIVDPITALDIDTKVDYLVAQTIATRCAG